MLTLIIISEMLCLGIQTVEVLYKYHPAMSKRLKKRQNFEGCGPLEARTESNSSIAISKYDFQRAHDEIFKWNWMIQMQKMENPALGQLPTLLQSSGSVKTIKSRDFTFGILIGNQYSKLSNLGELYSCPHAYT